MVDPTGIILGALLGFVSAYLLARYQAGREDRYRFAMLKEERYAEFVRLARERARNHRAPDGHASGQPGHATTGVPELGKSEPIDHLSSEIAILARERVWQASRDVYDGIVALDIYTWDNSKPPFYLPDDVDIASYRPTLEAFNRALERFLREAKDDLGTLRK